MSQENLANRTQKLLRFEDAPVWKDSISLAVEVYEFTKKFPKDELYGLTSQMRRAASSISANLAEGFGRNSQKEKIQFYSIAYGSLLELKSFTYLAKRLDYLQEIEAIVVSIETLQKQLNAIKNSLRKV
jgi:four helix bundle protein